MYSPFDDLPERPAPSSRPPAPTPPTYTNNPYGPPPGLPVSTGVPTFAGGNFPYRPPPPPSNRPPPPSYPAPSAPPPPTMPTGQREPLDHLLDRLGSSLNQAPSAPVGFAVPSGMGVALGVHDATSPGGNKYGFKKRKGRAPLILNEEEMHKRKRAKRFEANRAPTQSSLGGTGNNSPAALPDEGPIVGTCQTIEKDYFRMQETDPSKIRPEPILRLALVLLREKYKSNSMEYSKVCNQMKAIRQDMRVQQIRNSFAVEVYETHARMALENDDHEEFNQCQTQLATLYELNPKQPNEMEFTAYRILFQFFSRSHHGHMKLLHALQHLTADQHNAPEVNHAVTMCKELYAGNSREYLSLYRSTPHLGRLVLKRHVGYIREQLLQALTKSVRSSVSLEYLQRLLVFETPEECRAFLGPARLAPTGNISQPSSVMINLS